MIFNGTQAAVAFDMQEFKSVILTALGASATLKITDSSGSNVLFALAALAGTSGLFFKSASLADRITFPTGAKITITGDANTFARFD